MAAGSTYSQIATQTLGSSAASVIFSSIPQTYTNLVLITSPIMTSGTPELKIRFNSDGTNNYSFTLVYGDGGSAGSTRVTNSTGIDIGYYGVANTTAGGCVQITNIQNYMNTTTNKTSLTRANNTSYGTEAIVGLWRNTAAITSITIYPNSSTFDTGSPFSLYGIKGA